MQAVWMPRRAPSCCRRRRRRRRRRPTRSLPILPTSNCSSDNNSGERGREVWLYRLVAIEEWEDQ
ncbi:hypothetical protein E2C01_058253 [Portunus trituberculatus]|uniref:Uncharacterized protein n=1 Tax=Portunus trituberculatus TaxID=210409 RepID=A0A5B7GV39_PORTR|nr:hypothetical protein [Portunus trituberculatus]